MACISILIIPMLFSIITLLQGVSQLVIYAIFRHFSPFIKPFFAYTCSPLWAGAWNSFASLSLIFIFSNDPCRKWRSIRHVALGLFASIAFVQMVNWAMNEILEFRLWLRVDYTYPYGVKKDGLRWAYLSTLLAAILGVIIGWCGFFYVFVVFYRLANIMFNQDITERVQKVTVQRRTKGPSAKRASQTVDSWRYAQYRSSTPKSKSKLLHKLNFTKEPIKEELNSISSIHQNNYLEVNLNHSMPLVISDDDFNRSAPLRMIAMINPKAITFKDQSDLDDLHSPPLEECFSPKGHLNNNQSMDRSTPGHEMSTFHADNRTSPLIASIRKQRRNNGTNGRGSVPTPPPLPPTTPAFGVASGDARGSNTGGNSKPVKNRKTGSSSDGGNSKPKFVVPPTAWRLPGLHELPLAKALNFSDGDSKNSKHESSLTSDAMKKNTSQKSTSDTSETFNHL